MLDLLEDHGALRRIQLLDADGHCHAPEPTETWEATPDDRRDVLLCCLEAHRALMTLKPENAAKFQLVEKYLAEELERASVVAP
jgi:hypothetical protein